MRFLTITAVTILLFMIVTGCKSRPERTIEHIEAGRVEQAERIVEDYLAKEGESSRAYNFLGVILTEKKQYEEAIESFEKAIALEKGEVELGRLYYNMAVAYARLKRGEKAMKSFKKSLDYDESNSRAYYYTGMLYYESGDIINCIKEWEIYVAKSDNLKNVEAIENLLLKLRGVY